MVQKKACNDIFETSISCHRQKDIHTLLLCSIDDLKVQGSQKGL